MQDGVEASPGSPPGSPGDRALDRPLVAKVRLTERDAQTLDERPVPAREVVEEHDLVPGAPERAHAVRPDVTGSARREDSHTECLT